MLTLPDHVQQQIVMVDTRERLTECLNQVSASSTVPGELVIGLDTEFSPQFMTFEEQ